MIYPPSKAWIVGIPNLPDNPVNFEFSTNLPPGKFNFRFMWFNSVWNIWVTLPSGEIRQAGPYSNTLSWTGFFDYYFSMVSTLDSIGQNDLSKVTMTVWQI